MLDWDAAVTVLRDADEVALTCHLGPDGDALGSLLALHLGLRQLGTKTVASWSEPFRIPPLYSFLPGLDTLVPPAEFPEAPKLLVTFDTGSVDRLGDLAPLVDRAECVVVVDHHASNTRYGDINLVDPDAAASAVLVYELLQRLGVPLTKEIAACLYTGVVTDTGSFKYQATSPSVHQLAAQLLDTGIDHAEIARLVWDTNRFAYVQLLGAMLGRAQLEPEHDLIWTWVDRDDLAARGLLLDEIEGVIDVLRTTAEADVAAVLKQAPNGRWVVSTRSKGGADVGQACVSLGGGGHRFAAGFTGSADRDRTIGDLRRALR